MSHNSQIKSPVVLGIETSCDETAVAIVSADKQILAHKILSQIDTHNEFGGVVPEIAARCHITHLDSLIAESLDEASLTVADLDGIAATTGPGLIGGLMVGVMTAKAMAKAAKKPFIAVNHLAGHALTARLNADVEFPFLLMLMSGGHCQILDVRSVADFKRLGTTIDDAAGEAFDKTAKLLGLGYPGGPAVEAAAKNGNPDRFKLPRPLLGRPGCDFSFSGLKSAVRRIAETCSAQRGALYEDDVADLCACFQSTMGRCLSDRLKRGMAIFRENHTMGQTSPARLVVAGGVAANSSLRETLESLCIDEHFTLYAPPMDLCTDNGAMIAWAGCEMMMADERYTNAQDDQNVAPRPRWPLDNSASAKIGSGKKGAKA